MDAQTEKSKTQMKNNSYGMKNKSKLAKFWDGLGLVFGIVYFMPASLWESVSDRLKKRKEEKKPQPKPIQFICSECGETFEADSIEKEMRTQGSSENAYPYSSPQPCPKCGGKRTCPIDADMGFYQRIWGMEEASSFISHLSINWGHNDCLVDKGKREFRCTQCGSTFSVIDIKSHPYSASFPSRCPHCQSIRTLPASDENSNNHYESIWLVMELAEKEREERKTEAKNFDLKEMFGSPWD